MSKEETKNKILRYTVQLAAFVIFMIPIINTAIQIEIQTNMTIPVHWAMVISAAAGGGLATIVEIIRKVYQDHKAELEKHIEALNNTIRINGLERDITERDIMLNTACLNEQWLIKNASIEQLENALNKKKNS